MSQSCNLIYSNVTPNPFLDDNRVEISQWRLSDLCPPSLLSTVASSGPAAAALEALLARLLTAAAEDESDLSSSTSSSPKSQGGAVGSDPDEALSAVMALVSWAAGLPEGSEALRALKAHRDELKAGEFI